MQYFPNSVIDWLEEILARRFGVAVILISSKKGYVDVKLSGAEGIVRIISDAETFTRQDSEIPCGEWDAEKYGWTSALGKPLPTPGLPSPTGNLVEIMEGGFVLKYDILGLAYWVLTRQEEIGSKHLNRYGNFPVERSHAFKNGYLERPIVDEWLCLLSEIIKRNWSSVPLKNNRPSVNVSHDVDQPSRYAFRGIIGLMRGMAGDIIKRGDFRAFFAPVIKAKTRKKLHINDPFNTFDWLMDVSERKNLVSCFYFIPFRNYSSYDCDYELSNPAILELLKRINSRGHRIGLHPSYNSFRDKEKIIKEADRLRSVCRDIGIRQAEWGARMHFLQWEQPTTLRALDSAGLDYDNTLTYAERPGFRCGTCFEYPAIDPITHERLKIRIKPLIAMECSLLASEFLGLGVGAQAYQKFSELKKTCFSVGGEFSLLWHNSELSQNKEKRLYEAVVNND